MRTRVALGVQLIRELERDEEKSDFDTFVPPYRWRIVEGCLPDGLWRVNPLTGVIWGTPEEAGDAAFVVEVQDRAGAAATATLTIRVADSGEVGDFPPVPWVFTEHSSSGSLRVTTQDLPGAVAGKEYSAVLLAEGGEPFSGPPKRPGSGRYWEFADDTLAMAYARDMVDLGDDGDVIPRIKTYASSLGEQVVQNQQTWWPAKSKGGSPFAGFTQDATKHLKKMLEDGLTQATSTSSKPEHLIARLLEVFTSPGDVALEVFGANADLAAVAIKLSRRAVCLTGSSERDQVVANAIALPRLHAVVDGLDVGLESREGQIRLNKDAYIPFEGGGWIVTCRVGDWVFEQQTAEDFPRMNRGYSLATQS